MENGPVRDMASCNLDLHEINKAIIGRDRDASHARREVKLHHPLCSFLQVVIVGHDNTTTTATLAQLPHHPYHHPWRTNTTMKSKPASTKHTMTFRLRSRNKKIKKNRRDKNPSRDCLESKCVAQAKLDQEFRIGVRINQWRICWIGPVIGSCGSETWKKRVEREREGEGKREKIFVGVMVVLE